MTPAQDFTRVNHLVANRSKSYLAKRVKIAWFFQFPKKPRINVQRTLATQFALF